jgi:hypothetical protein
MANSPTYYRRGHVEVWDFIRDQGLNYHLGNAIKYICRAGYKDDKYIQDLTKAIHYLQNELLHAAGGGIPLENGTRQLKVCPTCTTDTDL